VRNVVRVAVTVLAVGVVTGWVTVGVLGRLAMLVIARANPEAAGLTSDDGFEIGTFTLDGSLNLLVVGGTFFGVLSAVFYLLLRPLMIGPGWFRLLSVSVGAGVVVGSMLVHTEGVDFTALQPVWLTVGLFVLLPVAHVAVLSFTAERLLVRQQVGRWTPPGLVAWPSRAALAVLFAVAVLDLANDVATLT
jgi:hypothetical protein